MEAIVSKDSSILARIPMTELTKKKVCVCVWVVGVVGLRIETTATCGFHKFTYMWQKEHMHIGNII